LPDYIYPVIENIKNPLIYLDEILKLEPEYVLLDHWFINDDLDESPLGYRFLKALDEKLQYEEETITKKFFFFEDKKKVIKRKNIKTQFISISDNGEKLKDRDIYNRYIKDYIISKNANDIIQLIK